MTTAIGIYGKVRTQGDFLREAAGDIATAGFDRWLEEAVGVLSTERSTLPEVAAGFLFCPERADRASVGALVPSEDKVGRRFPLLVFTDAPAAAVKTAWSGVPNLYASFARAAGELALAGRDLDAATFVARAGELAATVPTPPRGDEVPQLSNETTLTLATALDSSPPALAYALRTFATACDQSPKPGSSGAAITVDAPAPSPAVRAMWLELAVRRWRRRGASPPPLLLWTEGTGGRLLLSMGAPAPAMLAFLANPRHRSQRFWPLRTEVAAAASQALAALTPTQRQCVEDPRTSLAKIVSEFG